MPFMEISAKNGENVNDLFVKMGEMLLDDYLPNRSVEKFRYSLSSNAHITLS
jgi:hypothetical protein